MPVRRLDRLLAEAGFSCLHYLNIDVEGYENEVLAGFTVERWKPLVMVIESWDDDLVTPPGYTQVHRAGKDNIYRRDA